MVKLRGRNRKEGSAGSGATTPPAVVMGGRSRSLKLPHLSRKSVPFLLIVIIIATGLYLYHRHKVEHAAAYIPSKNQALQQEVNDLLARPPSRDASAVAKADYYTHLQIAQEDVGNFKGAVDAFESRKGIPAVELTYLNYYYGAKDYCKTGDKSSARKELAQSKALIIQQANRSNGDDPARAQAVLDKLAQECGL